ncbi:MAG: DMT family transporter [Bacteroidota bacterium]
MEQALRRIFPPHIYPWFLIIVLTLTWGSSFIMLKKALQVYSPEQAVAGRMIVAGLAFLPYALRRVRQFPRKFWLRVTAFALLANVLTSFLYATAQTSIDSGLNGIINTLTPLMTLLVGILFYREKGRLFQWLGLGLGFMGTIALLYASGQATVNSVNLFALVAIMATVCNGFTANMLKFNLKGLSALDISGMAFLVTFPLAIGFFSFTGGFSLAFSGAETFQATAYLILLGLLANALALILITRLIQLTSPVFATLTTYLIPLVAVSWGFLDGEKIGAGQLAAMGVILVSVYLINRTVKPQKA